MCLVYNNINLTLSCFKQLRKLKIWHDGSGFGSSWHLSGVNVEYENKKGNRVLHQFPVDRWIEGSKTNENGIALEAKAEQRNDKAVKDLQSMQSFSSILF